MQLQELTLASLVAAVTSRTPLAFSRWGDGEWHSVFGRTRTRNCDGHRYFAGMGKELLQVLLSRPPYWLGMQALALRVFQHQRIERWLAEQQLADLAWVDADVLHHASMRSELTPLIDAIRANGPIVLGPAHLQRLAALLGTRTFIAVPDRDSYLALPALRSALEASAEAAPAGTVISLSAGMPAKLLLDGLYNGAGRRHILLDCGSVWDLYAGVKSRRYMQGMAVPPLPQ